MQTFSISTLERQQGGFTHRFVIKEDDLTATATATAQTLNLMALPVGTLVQKVATRLVTPFADSADSANNTNTITIGDTGSAARYLASQQVNANGTPVKNKAGTGTALAFDAADTLQIVFGAPTTGKTLAALDTGELHVFVGLVALDQLAGA